MVLVGLNGEVSFTAGLFIVNMILLGIVVLKRSFLILPYGITSLLFLLAWPQNMIILFVLLTSFWTRWGLVLAPAFKLPIGAGLPVWRFFLSNPDSLHAEYNWPVYGVLVAWWIGGFIFTLRRNRAIEYPSNEPRHSASNFNIDVSVRSS